MYLTRVDCEFEHSDFDVLLLCYGKENLQEFFMIFEKMFLYYLL